VRVLEVVESCWIVPRQSIQFFGSVVRLVRLGLVGEVRSCNIHYNDEQSRKKIRVGYGKWWARQE
jgi:hypothetical protein